MCRIEIVVHYLTSMYYKVYSNIFLCSDCLSFCLSPSLIKSINNTLHGQCEEIFTINYILSVTLSMDLWPISFKNNFKKYIILLPQSILP